MEVEAGFFYVQKKVMVCSNMICSITKFKGWWQNRQDYSQDNSCVYIPDCDSWEKSRHAQVCWVADPTGFGAEDTDGDGDENEDKDGEEEDQDEDKDQVSDKDEDKDFYLCLYLHIHLYV